VAPLQRLAVLAALVALPGCGGHPADVTPAPTPEATERLAIMQRLLKADSSRVTGSEPDSAGVPTRRLIHVDLFRPERRASVPFIVARQRAGGWLVYAIGLAPLMPTPNRRGP